MAMGQKMTARRKAAVVNWLRSSHAVACAAGETESQPAPPLARGVENLREFRIIPFPFSFHPPRRSQEHAPPQARALP